MGLALPQSHPSDIDLVIGVNFFAALVRLERVLVLAWLRVQGLGFRVWELVHGLGFRVQGLGFGNWFMV